MLRYDQGKGAVVIPLHYLHASEVFPILPVIVGHSCLASFMSQFFLFCDCTLQEYVKLPSYFGCLFDFPSESFLCKGDDSPKASARKTEEFNKHPQNRLIPSEPTVDDEILENEKAILQKLATENSKELPDMRFYFSICKGFPKHGVRGGRSYWIKASFKDSKFSQKLQQHGNIF